MDESTAAELLSAVPEPWRSWLTLALAGLVLLSHLKAFVADAGNDASKWKKGASDVLNVLAANYGKAKNQKE